MNRCTTQQTISKQECMELLSDIPLVQCSENIQINSVSDSKRLSKKSQRKNDIASYIARSIEQEKLSFAQFLKENMTKSTKK